MSDTLKILIIGGQSMIGRRLAAQLKIAFFVKTAGRHQDDDFWLDLLESDLSSELAQSSFDIVVHCAASFADNSLEGFIQNQKTNALGALQVARLLQKTGCNRLIYLSSLFVFDHPDNGYYGSYGLSKRQAQETLELYCRFNNIYITTLILPQIYDEFGEAKKHQPLLYKILEAASKSEEFILHGSHAPKRNFLFISDATSIIQKIIKRSITGNYVCIHPKSHTLREIAEIAFNTFEHPLKISLDPTKPDPPSVFIPDDFSLYEKLDYFPETSLKAGFSKYRQCVEAMKPCP